MMYLSLGRILEVRRRSRATKMRAWWRVARAAGTQAFAIPRNRPHLSTQTVALYALAAVGATAAAVTSYSSTEQRKVLLEAPNNGKKYAPLTRSFIADAVEKAFPAVVNIAVDSGYLSSNGSGFIISEDGLVVTNAHVVARCNRYSKIQITFADGSKSAASVHSSDPLSDIAILQIESTEKRKWPVIKLGASSDVRAGEWVCALGSPFSLQNSVSAGIISAVARHSSELGFPQKGGEYIQTDAAINSGNSGGPLVNLDGEVIGINTMKVDGSVGISFAIPIDTATQVIEQLLKHKKVVRAYIGMQMINFNANELRELSRIFPDVTEGVIIRSVVPGSPAHKGGLTPGDIIVSFDGKVVKSTKDILTAVGYSVGRKIDVQVKRRGEATPRLLSIVTEPIPEQVFQRGG